MTAPSDRGWDWWAGNSPSPIHRGRGTGLGSQTSQAGAERQEGRGGWGAEPSRSTSGLPASGWGGPHSSAPPQAAGHPHLSQDLCAWYGVLEAMPCWVGGEGCAPGGDGVPGWGGPAQPCMALSSWAGRPWRLGRLERLAAPPPGTKSLTHLFTTCTHTRWQPGMGGHAVPLPQPPRDRASRDQRLLDGEGLALQGRWRGLRGCPSSHPPTPGGTPLSAAGSEVIKIDTTGWFLTGREEGVTLPGAEGRAGPWAREGGAAGVTF